jgi:ethanolamine utilization protein EutA
MAQGDPTSSPSHSLSDHDFGALARHEHGEGEYDHDHDDDFADIGSYDGGDVSLISMGLDVGSSGTQVIFTRLEMRGAGEHRALLRHVKSRKTLYMSEVAPTPFVASEKIDEDRLWDILARAFQGAGLTPDDVETGVVILTGTAALRDNAALIADRVARECGDLVCAAAGHHMEAVLAAYGSGLVALSREGMGRCLLNIDIGGGTIKFSIVEDGHIRHTAAMMGGGRLIVIDRDHRIVRLEPAGVLFARRAGYDLSLGDIISDKIMADVARAIADALMRVLTEPDAEDIRALYVTDVLSRAWLHRVEGVRASGGVAEFIYGRESRDFWDLGRGIGLALDRFSSLPFPLVEAGECIRATAFGASQFTVQLSGQTLFISSPLTLLPARNLPVIKPDIDFAGDLTSSAIEDAIKMHRHHFDLSHADARFALAFRWRGSPDYARLLSFARGVQHGCADILAVGGPLYIMLEGDLAHNVGAILKNDIGLTNDVLVIDGVALRDFDYIDIGRIRLPSHTVPVTVKSLLFGAVQKKG